MVKRSLEIIEFEPIRPVPEGAAVPEPGLGSTRVHLEPRTLTGIGAALGSFALHALLLAPAIWGAVSPRTRLPDLPYAGAAVMQWVVLEDSPSPATRAVSSLTPPVLRPIAVTAADPQLQMEPVMSADSQSNSDQSGLAALYGRYTGQIHARIERAWARPRTSPGEAGFRCEVEIDQDHNGRIGEIALVDCDGDTRWRLSLVRAIEAASPLPAPPVAAVFANRVVLNFVAIPYSSGAPPELYEPAAQASSDAILEKNENALRTLQAASRGMVEHTVIEIRIDGSAVEVERKAPAPRTSGP